MADNTMLIVLLAAGAGAFYLMQSGKLGGGGGAGAEEPVVDPAASPAPTTPAVPTAAVAPLPVTIPPTQPINIYNIHQRVQRPPIVVRSQPQIPVVYTVGPSNRAVILKQLTPSSIDLAYTRVAQYIIYFHTGKKGPVDYRWVTFARDRARLAVSKGHGHSHKFHGKFADKFLEVAYRIQFAPTSREVEIISRDAANIFISLEQTDPQLLIKIS